MSLVTYMRIASSPSGWVRPNYGVKVQMAPLVDDSKLLNKALITRLQEIVGTLLHYTRAVDNTMLVALSTLGSAQSKGT